MDSADQTSETQSSHLSTDDQNDNFVPIKVDPSRMNDLMLRLDDRGLEDRLHSDFYDNLIKFGIDKKYVDSMREDFAFEKLDLKAPVRSFDEEEEEQIIADRFIKTVEIEELQLQLEEGSSELTEAERTKINLRIVQLQKEINETEVSLSFGMMTLDDSAQEQKQLATQKLKAKKDD